MLSIPHMATGAFIASKLPHPLLYIPLTLAFHYLEDWIPHWDVGTGLSRGTRKRSTAILLELVDLALAGALIWYMYQNQSPDALMHIWIGATTGIAPDLVEAPRNFLKWEPWFLKPFNDFHGKFHHSTPNILFGLAPQAVVLVALWMWK